MINAAFLLAALAGAPPMAESKPRGPRLLPDDRSRVCERECYLLREGCEGRCRLRVEEDRRDVVILARIEDIPDEAARVAARARYDAYVVAQADERARTEAARTAAAAAKRLADTPAKTLRRRARGGDEDAAAELVRRADSPAREGADAGRDPGSKDPR